MRSNSVLLGARNYSIVIRAVSVPLPHTDFGTCVALPQLASVLGSGVSRETGMTTSVGITHEATSDSRGSLGVTGSVPPSSIVIVVAVFPSILRCPPKSRSEGRLFGSIQWALQASTAP